MATSSASPENLNVFVTQAGQASTELGTKISQVKTEVDGYMSLPSDYKFVNGTAVIGDAVTFNNHNQDDEKFVSTIRTKFIQADTNTLPDSSIEKALADAGVSLAPRAAITVNEPMFNGKPITSGFSDDPVCTATGHFLEIEDDLAMPAPLRVLRWTRTYSSRFIVRTPLGRGWYSWASTELIEQDGEVDYHGPDGQVAVFLPDDEGFHHNPGIEAEVTRDGDGLVLRWRWTSRFPGMAWFFDGAGHLERIEDPFGGTTTCTRDDSGRLSAMVHEGGRRLDIEWDGNVIVAVTASDGRRVEYRYDNGDLVECRRAAGDRLYTVDEAGRITEVVDADGVRVVGNEYDDEGRVLAQRSPFGRVTRYRYLMPLTVIVGDDEGGPATLYRHDLAGRLVELHTAEGTRMTRQFDEYGNPVRVVGLDGGVTARAFDLAGNCVNEVRPDGTELRWRYDDRGRVIAYTDAVGAEFTMTYAGDDWYPSRIAGPLGWFLAFESRHGLPTRVTDADGVSRELVRDPDGSLVAIIDADGNRIEFVPHSSGGLSELRLPTQEQRRYELDDAGRILAEITPSGARTDNEYSPAGRVRSLAGPDGSSLQLGWGEHGAITTLTDPMGGVTSAEYNVLGDLTGVEWPGGPKWQFGYNGMGEVTTVEDPVGALWAQHWTPDGARAGFTDPLGYRWAMEADEMGRSSAIETPLGRRIEVRYDAMGRMIQAATREAPDDGNSADGVATAHLRRDQLGRPTELLADGEPVSRYTYTTAGRLRSLQSPDGSGWRFEYDRRGLMATASGPGGGQTRFEHDASERPVARVSPEGLRTEWIWGPDGQPAEVRHGEQATRLVRNGVGQITERHLPGGGVQRFAYDARGDLVEVVDPLGGVTRIERDERRNPVAVVDAKGARRQRQFDALGRLVAETDPLGRTTRRELDPAGRLATLALPDGSGQVFGWDPEGALASVAGEQGPLAVVERDARARRVRSRDVRGTVTEVEWDGRGRLVHHQVGRRTTAWAYDDANGRVTVIPPVGEAVVFETDAEERIARVEHGRFGTIELVRDLDGHLVELQAEGLRRVWQRDPQGRVTSYREQVGDRSQQILLERDEAGRVAVEHVDGRTWRYRYDAAGQLTGLEGPEGNWTWQYDPCGRLVEEETPQGRRHFVYDEADQLVSVETDEGTTEFDYDLAGRRLTERGPVATTRYRWDALGRLEGIDRQTPGGVEITDTTLDGLGWLAAAGDAQMDWLPGSALGELPLSVGDRQVLALPGLPIGTVGDDGVEWLSADWRGTVGATSMPWGSSAPADRGPHLGYLGEMEVEGRVWLRQRVYDPATHAFLSRDPLEGLAGWPGALTNPYAYANNDPLGWVDPLGLKPLSIDQANEQMKEWKHGHLAEVLITAAAVAVMTVIVVGTGGAALPLILGGVGVLAGAGGTLISDVVQHKPIDPMEVIMNGAVGGLVGMGSAFVPLPGPVLGRMGLGAAYGAVANGAASPITQYGATGTVNPADVGVDAGWGAVSGLVPFVKGSDFHMPAGQAKAAESLADTSTGIIQGHYQPLGTASGAITKGAVDGHGLPYPEQGPPMNAKQLADQLAAGG